MSLVHSDLQTLRTPLVPRQRRFSANWSRALILGTLLFATLNSSRAQDTGVLPQANLIRSTQASQKSRFNGTMSARPTNPAHLLVGEQEEEEDQTT